MKSQAADMNAAGTHIADDFRALAAHAEELLQATKTASGESVEAARKQLKESLKQAKEQAMRAEERAYERGKAALDATSGMVRENPWQALAAAVLLGAVIGCVASTAGKGNGSGR